ncbi:MAG: pseudouridine synthase [Geminicoccaceae bacterium]
MNDTANSAPPPGERIAKRIARAGYCSRRDAERLVQEGRVSVDGRTVESPALNVTGEQEIRIDGERLKAAEPARLFRYHKPAGVVTTAHDPEGRPTVTDKLRVRTADGSLPRLMPVGRLDFSSEGLLLLTNDGGLKRLLELPATGWLRRYRVRVYGNVDRTALQALADGIEVEGVRYGPIRAEEESRTGANAWLRVGLREGKNREVRRVLGHLGLEVSRLIRTAYGPFQLGRLARGDVEEVTPKVLKEQLGGLGAGLDLPESKSHSHERRLAREGGPPAAGTA